MLLPAERIREWSPLDGVPPPEWDGPHVGRRLVEGVRTLRPVWCTGYEDRSFQRLSQVPSVMLDETVFADRP
jgi:hypothetical protein